jgi:hypothetical protein
MAGNRQDASGDQRTRLARKRQYGLEALHFWLLWMVSSAAAKLAGNT